MDDENKMNPLFQDEMMFAGWKDSHSGGPVVFFRLSSSDALEPFKSMTVAKKGMAGQLLHGVIFEANDSGVPVSTEPAQNKVGQLCLLAVQFCKSPEFWQWTGVAENEQDAKEFILNVCEIGGRKELDTNSEAAEKFHRLIRIPFSRSKT